MTSTNPFSLAKRAAKKRSTHETVPPSALDQEDRIAIPPPKKPACTERIRKQKRGCMDIDKYLELSSTRRQKIAQKPVPQLSSAFVAKEKKNNSTTTTSPPIDVGCCNSYTCKDRGAHGHKQDDTFLGRVAENERKKVSGRIAEGTRYKFVRDQAFMHITPYPFDEKSNAAYAGVADRTKYIEARTMNAAFASADKFDAVAARILLFFRQHKLEEINLAATLTTHLQIIRQQFDERKHTIQSRARHANIETSNEIERLKQESIDMLSLRKAEKAKRERMLNLAVRQQLYSVFAKHKIKNTAILEARLLELLGTYTGHTNEQTMMDGIKAAMQGRQMTGRWFRSIANIAEDGDDDSGDAVAGNLYIEDVSTDQDWIDICESQYAALENCLACTSICVVAACLLARAQIDATKAGLGRAVASFVKDRIDWQQIVQTGVDWWTKRPNQDNVIEYANEVINVRRDYFDKNFHTIELGGMMVSVEPQGWPTPDCRTALRLCQLRAKTAAFACTITFHNKTLAIARFSSDLWYVFDSHGSIRADKSALVECKTEAAAFAAVCRLFNVLSSVKEVPNDGTAREDVLESNGRLAYHMTLFIAK